MKKITLFFILVVTSAFAMSIDPPDIVVQADGSTNYEGIHCTTESGKLSDGIVVNLTIDKSVALKWIDLFVINSSGETITYCGVEGRDQGSNVLYRVDIARGFLNSSELWVFMDGKGHVSLPFKQFK